MRRLQDLRAPRELVEDHGLERRSLGLHICQHAKEVKYFQGPRLRKKTLVKWDCIESRTRTMTHLDPLTARLLVGCSGFVDDANGHAVLHQRKGECEACRARTDL